MLYSAYGWASVLAAGIVMIISSWSRRIEGQLRVMNGCEQVQRRATAQPS
jgi:hypothetical protein